MPWGGVDPIVVAARVALPAPSTTPSDAPDVPQPDTATNATTDVPRRSRS